MTSRRPYWCPKTRKRRLCWCPKPILWELNSSYLKAFFCSNKFHILYTGHVSENTLSWDIFTSQNTVYVPILGQLFMYDPMKCPETPVPYLACRHKSVTPCSSSKCSKCNKCSSCNICSKCSTCSSCSICSSCSKCTSCSICSSCSMRCSSCSTEVGVANGKIRDLPRRRDPS